MLGVGFAVAVALTVIAVLLASSPPLDGSVEKSSTLILTVLGINLPLILGLAFVVGRRAFDLIDAGDAGAKLRARFVSQFALAAVFPAVVVALFFGVLVTRGVDQWFNPATRALADNTANLINAYVEYEKEKIEAQIAPMAMDLNRDAARLLEAPVTFNTILRSQAEQRGMIAAYVVDRAGNILARAESDQAPVYVKPSDRIYAFADDGYIGTGDDKQANVLRPLYKLDSINDAYLYVIWPLFPDMLTTRDAIFEARETYQEASASNGKIKTAFFLSYVETALLVLVGSVWLGLAAAATISGPISRLVSAAGRVSTGDLNARVDADSDPEEISVLSHAFNRMTHDLQAQQAALRSASDEAERRRRFTETVLSGVSAGVLGLDEHQHISAANTQAARLLGLSESALGRSLFEAAPEFEHIVGRAIEIRAEAEDEVDVVRGGETRRLRVRAGYSAGLGVVLTFDDITRLMAAQRNAAWKDVARRIAHEIKNPLTPIQLSAERIRRRYRKEITSDLETFDRCTDTIIRQVGDIGRMVDEFSAFARMPAPRMSAFDPAELLRQVAFAQRVASPDINVEIIEPLASDPTFGDPQMLGQGLANLLKNAAEAVSARKIQEPDLVGRISVSLNDEPDQLCFMVEDNGVGLPTKDRERLTEPYVTNREKGTGLGLAIVKRIAEDHRGALILSDAPNKPGTRASIVLPREQTETKHEAGKSAATLKA